MRELTKQELDCVAGGAPGKGVSGSQGDVPTSESGLGRAILTLAPTSELTPAALSQALTARSPKIPLSPR